MATLGRNWLERAECVSLTVTFAVSHLRRTQSFVSCAEWGGIRQGSDEFVNTHTREKEFYV
jgi:hypothetical protein